MTPAVNKPDKFRKSYKVRLHAQTTLHFNTAILFDLMFTLNLNYLSQLKWTLKLFQEVLMKLDGNKLSEKVQILKKHVQSKQWSKPKSG